MDSSETREDWKENIKVKLISLYEKKDLEDLLRVLWYLDEEDRVYKDSIELPPVWNTLKTSQQCSDAVFERYAERVAEDVKRAENDVSFRKTMNRVYEEMMDQSEEPVPEESQQGFEFMRVNEVSLANMSAFMGLARAWEMIPPDCQAMILELIPKIVANDRHLMTCADEIAAAVSNCGTVVMVGLAAVYLTFEAYKNIGRWWKGEISGKRCAKNIIDSMVTIGAGIGGGYGGAAIGSLVGPIGAIAGGVIGGYVTSLVISSLIDRATQTLFDLPKEEALENAYNYLAVKMSASNYEINTAFRQLCLKHHPDKGGDKEEFLLAQLNMAVIKQYREDFITPDSRRQKRLL